MTNPYLEARFQRPPNYTHASYLSRRGANIRYGFIRAENEKAIAVHLGGQTQFLEMDYENATDLAKRGVTTYFLERHGDGGSTRCYADPQKPPALSFAIHVADLFKFVNNELLESRSKKLLLLGHCLGGLIGLKALQRDDHCFDHAIFTSPMFGTIHPVLNPDVVPKNTVITPKNETVYYGKAGDWEWERARRWFTRDGTSHDDARKAVHYLWRRHREDLRLGGFTIGNIQQNRRALLSALAPGAVERIKTPVTIISPSKDVINSTVQHQKVYERLPNGTLIALKGAGHGLWREADVWRNKVLDYVAQIAAEPLEGPTRRQAYHLQFKHRLWSFDANGPT